MGRATRSQCRYQGGFSEDRDLYKYAARSGGAAALTEAMGDRDTLPSGPLWEKAAGRSQTSMRRVAHTTSSALPLPLPFFFFATLFPSPASSPADEASPSASAWWCVTLLQADMCVHHTQGVAFQWFRRSSSGVWEASLGQLQGDGRSDRVQPAPARRHTPR